MITGIGVDIIQLRRIKNAIERWQERFISRVYTQGEINYCRRQKMEFIHFAARFAAKEATMKALGRRVGWENIEIINDERGKPSIKLSDGVRGVAMEQQAEKIFLSLSHDGAYAIAQVVTTK
ncbi:holo-[acyl-carrier-protein] synthase [candidate division NPL-UPA2 bacterium Unc8]|uniref:Holo-[acyl-carrier-protein] synthase n=1 Tax=candidate division NPL-UPA2 bacterium Unc8 TaxID=1980939 RepID=A0A399FVB4_UNCN2|nr:Holo-(acyl-carrier-protein) synthase [Bacillota bacterium]MBT9138307.1 Holo-(acyl-carrier-protein) synthase [Bacillota bacterium]MBT9148007.1 Holo-(acyl-carrier-protein) synthase [Bacillota bacterium]RII00041.1 MAG: holo-[acyl-carrier-protein] synthase [candidate division NPL-UPA2 bacterium Unc8]